MSMNPPRRHLILIGHERTDARIGKRIRAFQDFGWEVTAFTFHRSRPGRSQDVPFANIDLGITQDRAYARRLVSLVKALGVFWRERARLRSASAVYAVNTDNALLGMAIRLMARRRVPLFVEIADIQPPFVDPGIKGRGLRWIEKRVLQAAGILITTSPAFLREYFIPRLQYTGRVFLLENKVYPSRALQAINRGATITGPPWRIGWFGALRCRASWNAMRTLARRHPETLQFIVRGYPTLIDPDAFQSEAGDLPNIEFGGPYRYPDELPTLHDGLHFVWGFDFSDPSANSRWLLPNRLYEAGLLGVPVLAAAGTETGRRVAADLMGPGLNLGADSLAEGLEAFFNSLQPSDWEAWRRSLEARPTSDFAGEADYAALSEMMALSALPAS